MKGRLMQRHTATIARTVQVALGAHVVCQVPMLVNSQQVQQNMQDHTAMLVMGHATSHHRQL